MREKQQERLGDKWQYKILIVDDEYGIIDAISSSLKRRGYIVEGITDPIKAIEKLKHEDFDLLVLDYLMSPIHADKVVERVREFNKELYILLLTGHKDIAPPLETIRNLDIQGYCEKGDKLDQFLLLVDSGIKSINLMNTIRQFKNGLNKILGTVPKIYQLQPIDKILEEILQGLLALVSSENAFIMIDNIKSKGIAQQKSIYKGIGKFKVTINKFMKLLAPEFMESMGQARQEKRLVYVDGGVLFPLLNELKKTIGVLFIESDHVEEGLKILEIYANQAASSLSNASLHSLVNIKNEELNRTYAELKKRYEDTIEALRLAVDAKDIYTKGHSDRVAYYAVKIGKALKLSKKELDLLKLSGIFHDVGKIGTADDILFKQANLSVEEYEEIKKHPLKGAHILSAVDMFKDIIPLIKCHHERVDGKGYPQGLKGEDIPFLAKILVIADAFDAMTTDRKYRSKLNIEQAREQLEKGAGTQFDDKIVKKFVKILKNFDKIQKELEFTHKS